jgi:hypothetical protein
MLDNEWLIKNSKTIYDFRDREFVMAQNEVPLLRASHIVCKNQPGFGNLAGLACDARNLNHSRFLTSFKMTTILISFVRHLS